MNRIVLSLGTLVFAGAAIIASTGAFFNDTETANGNTFASGSIDLTVDSTAHYDGLVCAGGPPTTWQPEQGQTPETVGRPDLIGLPCDGTWTQTDLGPEHKFFNLSDLKPGDDGENTFSFHVTSNPAWACAIIDNVQDNEVDQSCTEPEDDEGDSSCNTSPQNGMGELSQELHFFAWSDMNNVNATPGDNIWQGPTAEPVLFSNVQGPASDILNGVSYMLFGPGVNGGIPMVASTTQYIGLYWCYGEIGGTDDGPLTCNGQPVSNVSQTDQFSADITFYAEQSRNNPNFECPQPATVVDVCSNLDGNQGQIPDGYEDPEPDGICTATVE